MSSKLLSAGLLLESKTFRTMLHRILQQHNLNVVDFDNAQDLLAQVANSSELDVLFIGKESAIKAGLSPEAFLKELRRYFNGPVLLVSTEQDLDNIEHYVSSGVTDVFSLAEVEQIDNFIVNFISFKNAVNSTDKAKVLLVEDSKSMTSMVQTLFEQNNMEVMFIPTGREALTVLHFENIDLVVTDYMLEGDMTGLALVRNIRRTSQWYSLPILAITGYNDPERNKELLRNGVSDIMHKPFDMEMFLIKCQNLIFNKRTFQNLMEKQSKLTELTKRDATTGVYNRQYLLQQLDQLLTTGKAFLLHIDLDEFTSVNEKLSFTQADETLKQVAQFIGQLVNSEHLLARIEGDEFMLLLSKVQLDTAIQIADLIRESVAQHDFSGVKLTASIGISMGQKGALGKDILQDCKAAVVKAKQGGKNTVEIGQLVEF